MINTNTQQHVDQVLTVINVVELIQGVSLKGCFLETAKWRALVEAEDYGSALTLITQLKGHLDAFNPQPDIVQMFDQIERDLLKTMICAEHEMQNAMGKVVLSAYNQVGRWTSDFERAFVSFDYSNKDIDLKKIITCLENKPFKGSAMVITLIKLIIESNNRVIELNLNIVK